MNLTILEGPDGAGKTTLAKSYKALEYVHFGPPPKGRLGAWWQYLELLVDLWDHPRPEGVIVDRFIHGELIYGPILRGETDLTWSHIRMLERVLMGMNARLIICLPPWDIVKYNWQQRPEQELVKTEAQLWEIYQFYMQLLGSRQGMLPRHVYDYMTGDLPPAMDNRIGFINQGPGIGLFAPGNTLLIGDQVNPRHGKEDWPFVSSQGCSIWLAEQLDLAQVPEHSLYWVNARVGGQDISPAFIDRLEPGKVIAMGSIAHRWCQKHKLGHTEVQHPQYHKRFIHNSTYPLLQELLK